MSRQRSRIFLLIMLTLYCSFLLAPRKTSATDSQDILALQGYDELILNQPGLLYSIPKELFWAFVAFTTLLLLVLAALLISIAKRQRVETSLLNSEQRFTKIFHTSPNMMCIIDPADLSIIDVNHAYLEHSGYRLEEIIGRAATIISQAEDRGLLAQAVSQLRQGKEVKNRETSYVTKTGQQRQALASCEFLLLDKKEYLLLVATDITERKRLQEELVHLDKMNIVGQMAAGIGHEIRNPMTTVRGFLQFMQESEQDINTEYFNIMIAELDRANEIITEFLGVARNREINMERLALNDIIQKLYPLIQTDAIKQNKEVKLKLTEVPKLCIDGNEIRQLLINLVRNALEASQPSGQVWVSTSHDDTTVRLAVKDEGQGIDPSILPKLGTPFVTTKADGTGLGLAICYSIAERHGATIEITTGAMGTTFTVVFPINQSEAA